MNLKTPAKGALVGGLPRVNLLPKSERDRRSNTALGRRWIVVGLGAILVVVVLVGGGYVLNMMSSIRLSSEQNRATQLVTELADLAPVSKAIAQRSALSAQLEEAMAGDLAWSPVLQRLSRHLPGGAAITGYDLVAGDVPAGEEEPATLVGLDGTLTVSTPEPLSVVQVTQKLRGLDDVNLVDIRQLTREDGDEDRYDYTIRVVLDQSIYSGAYAPEQAADKDGE